MTMLHYLGAQVAYAAVILLNALAPVSADVERDVAYAPGPSHLADVYRPSTGEGCPVVVFLYGGGWRTGSKEGVASVGAALARNGFVAVVPEYRHFPEVGLPDILADNAAAVAWAIAHAPAFGGDPRRVVVAGHSSGAWAAAMLALDATWLERAGTRPDALAGMIGLAGPYAVSTLTDRADQEVFAGAGPEMEPINDRPERHPPMLLLTGADDADVLPSGTTALADRLRGRGGEAEAHVYAGLGHGEIVEAVSFPFLGRSSVSDDIEHFVRGAACR